VAEVRTQSRQAPPATPPAYGPGPGDAPELPRSGTRFVKHALDRLAAACGLIVLAPLMAIVALGLQSATGRVLRREERVGEGGRTIVLRSFAITDALRERSPVWRLVAATGIGTLPQLWSVLRGELSVIGPRPREHGNPAPPMRPGLTGLAQLEQLERWLSVTEQTELDLEYACTWSLALDARIVWRTLWGALR
jgi:lipopolysaccharide/colanic/teichoic acid biosynthesis glycosyltransferase